jgi:hypothetical protein
VRVDGKHVAVAADITTIAARSSSIVEVEIR